MANGPLRRIGNAVLLLSLAIGWSVQKQLSLIPSFAFTCNKRVSGICSDILGPTNLFILFPVRPALCPTIPSEEAGCKAELVRQLQC
jgi:hypothetical protein